MATDESLLHSTMGFIIPTRMNAALSWVSDYSLRTNISSDASNISNVYRQDDLEYGLGSHFHVVSEFLFFVEIHVCLYHDMIIISYYDGGGELGGGLRAFVLIGLKKISVPGRNPVSRRHLTHKFHVSNGPFPSVNRTFFFCILPNFLLRQVLSDPPKYLCSR